MESCLLPPFLASFPTIPPVSPVLRSAPNLLTFITPNSFFFLALHVLPLLHWTPFSLTPLGVIAFKIQFHVSSEDTSLGHELVEHLGHVMSTQDAGCDCCADYTGQEAMEVS